ncbi:MAG: bifunctional glutamate N-acetyltransferase/amino-acid acetyltransferase ArgJ, partial [Endomicrobium sp.]|nr:bifunctional glutamate N-acetyltransferase/amino-acid acetyltransferase ArgJ [Endomicrobium sp.]
MLPKGFKVSGVCSGISKEEHKKDLALFISELPASVAGMFTSSVTKAAPVLVDIEKLKKGGKFSAILANSGCANACTGTKGKRDAEDMCLVVENFFNLKPGSVLCASTGIIGKYLNISKNKFKKDVELLKNNLGFSLKNEDEAVLAIMTTDTCIKKISRRFKTVNGNIVKIWGCVKGSGMIHPNMQGYHATMLSFILTDAEIDSNSLQRILENSIEQSFHCVSVDGDTSTNDTIIVLANGKSGAGRLSKIDLKNFIKIFNELTLELAKSIVKDGEGATKFIEIEVKNTKTKSDARIIASAIATSPLFKTAIFGADANWGRVVAAASRSGVSFNPDKVDIYIASVCTLKNGVASNFSELSVKKSLLKKEVKVVVDFKL